MRTSYCFKTAHYQSENDWNFISSLSVENNLDQSTMASVCTHALAVLMLFSPMVYSQTHRQQYIENFNIKGALYGPVHKERDTRTKCLRVCLLNDCLGFAFIATQQPGHPRCVVSHSPFDLPQGQNWTVFTKPGVQILGN